MIEQELRFRSGAAVPDFRARGWATQAGSPAVVAGRGAVATLLTSSILRDGELVLLVIRPSRWFVVLTSLPMVAGVLLAWAGVYAGWGPTLPITRLAAEAAILLVIARLMWAVLQWMGRLYVLTDLRVLRFNGVFAVEVFECPLRKIAKTWVLRPWRERMLGLGSVLIVPADPDRAAAAWQTLSRPDEVEQAIREAISRTSGGPAGLV